MTQDRIRLSKRQSLTTVLLRTPITQMIFLNQENSSVKKNTSIPARRDYKDYKGIELKILMSENDPGILRLYEAFYIRKYKPTLNSQEECTKFADLEF